MQLTFELIRQGGWFLVPIFVASLVAVALFLERVLYLRRANILGDELSARASGLIASGDRAGLRALCARAETPLARVLERGLERARATATEMRESMEGAGRRELYFMRRYTGALGSIATISPLLGLLGTVVGMIAMFQGLVATAAANRAAVDVGVLADGIWQALLTTAAGLVVAIPTYLAHRYLMGRIDGFISVIEDLGRDAIARFARDVEHEGHEGHDEPEVAR